LRAPLSELTANFNIDRKSSALVALFTCGAGPNKTYITMPGLGNGPVKMRQPTISGTADSGLFLNLVLYTLHCISKRVLRLAVKWALGKWGTFNKLLKHVRDDPYSKLQNGREFLKSTCVRLCVHKAPKNGRQ